MIFTYQCTGIHPGLWSINIKSEGSESTGAEPKLKSSMVLVKMEGLVCRLETDGDNRVVPTPHPETAGLKWLFVVQELQTVLQQIQNNSNTKNYHKYQKNFNYSRVTFLFCLVFLLVSDADLCLVGVWKVSSSEDGLDSSWSLRQSSEKSFHMCVLLSLPTQPQLHASIACRVGNTPLARTSQSAWGDDITHPGERQPGRAG